MRSKLHGLSQFHGRPVFQSPLAGWIFQPAGYEVDTPKTAEVKLPVSGASWEVDALAMSEGLNEAAADGNGDADAEGEGVETAPGPVPGLRNGPTTARTTTPTAMTAAAAIAALADMFMSWNL